MKIVFAIAGAAYLIEEEITTSETINAVIARIARKLHTTLEDLILVYKAVEPFEKRDAIVKEIQEGNLSAHIRRNLQSISMEQTVSIRASTANRVHFVLDVPSPVPGSDRFYYATDRRYLRLAESAKMWDGVSRSVALFCCILLRMISSSTFTNLGIVFGFAAYYAFLVVGCAFKRKAKGKPYSNRDKRDDCCVTIDNGDEPIPLSK